jgi:hypothetical protein
VEWYSTVHRLFGSGNLGATQSSTTEDLDAFSPGLHGAGHGLSHCSAEGNSSFQLFSNVSCNQESIELRLANLLNVQASALAGELLKVTT